MNNFQIPLGIIEEGTLVTQNKRIAVFEWGLVVESYFPVGLGWFIRDKECEMMFAGLFSEVKQRHSKSLGDRLEGYSGYAK